MLEALGFGSDKPPDGLRQARSDCGAIAHSVAEGDLTILLRAFGTKQGANGPDRSRSGSALAFRLYAGRSE